MQDINQSSVPPDGAHQQLPTANGQQPLVPDGQQPPTANFWQDGLWTSLYDLAMQRGQLVTQRYRQLLLQETSSILTLQAGHLLLHQSAYDIASQDSYFRHRAVTRSGPGMNTYPRRYPVVRPTVSVSERQVKLEWHPAPSSSRSARFYNICRVQQAVSESYKAGLTDGLYEVINRGENAGLTRTLSGISSSYSTLSTLSLTDLIPIASTTHVERSPCQIPLFSCPQEIRDIIYELVFTRPPRPLWGVWARATNARIVRIQWRSNRELNGRIWWVAFADLGDGKYTLFTRVNVLVVCKLFSLQTQDYLDRHYGPFDNKHANSVWKNFWFDMDTKQALNFREIRLLNLQSDPEASWGDDFPPVPSGPFLNQDESLAIVATYNPDIAEVSARFRVLYGAISNWTAGPRMLKALCQMHFLSSLALDFRIPVYVDGFLARAGLRRIAGLTIVVQPVIRLDDDLDRTESLLHLFIMANALEELQRHYEFQRQN